MMEVAVVDEYVDQGESARSADRQQLQAMLARLEERRDVDHVIVHKVDRLARNRFDDVTISLRLEQAGASLVSVSESIDGSPSGQFLHAIMAANAEFFSRNLALETKKGLRQKFESGGTVGLAPLGYLNIANRVDGHEVRAVAFDPDRAPLIRWAFERYASGEVTVTELHAALVAQGLTQRATRKRASKPISKSSLCRILANRYYIGYAGLRPDRETRAARPLVSETLFDQVQGVLEAHALAGERDRKHAHYLKGSLYCGGCGSRLLFSLARGKLGGKYPYFFCSGRQRRNGCSQRYLSVPEVEQAVARFYMGIELSNEDALRVRQRLKDHLQKQHRTLQRDAERAAKRLSGLEDQQLRLLQAHYAGAVPLDLLKREQDRLEADLRNARAAIAAAASKQADGERVIKLAVDIGANCGLAYLQAPENVRRDFNQAFFEKMYIRDPAEVADVEYTLPFRDVLQPTAMKPSGNERSPGDNARGTKRANPSRLLYGRGSSMRYQG